MGMDFKSRLERWIAKSPSMIDDLALILNCLPDDILAFKDGRADISHYQMSVLSLFGAANEKNRKSALSHAKKHRDNSSSEEWKVINGFSRYEVSSTGRVRRKIGGQSHPRILKQSAVKTGYFRVCLYDDKGKMVTGLIHRLVCLTFHGQPPQGKNFACHKNGNNQDNHYENLYWGSPADNSADAIRHGKSKLSAKFKILGIAYGGKAGTQSVKEILRDQYSRKVINKIQYLRLRREFS
jgi:NUMOD4 motif/HNH endonuclease